MQLGTFGQLVLGLGLFFIGMQVVGDSLRRASGASFRSLVTRFTGSRFLTGAIGLAFGALMQSATAVTFVLASMVSSRLIYEDAALPAILWCNVGLTALAFLAAVDIHPIVAWTVGLSGIASGLVRQPVAQTVTRILLGIGLLLLGLGLMSTGAAPLRDEAWFGSILAVTDRSGVLAFAVGIAAAAVLQSNTGAALLIITLASAGAFSLPQAMMLVYGTNLGAILLRLVLASGSRGATVRLVRFEDLFCLTSGVVMVTLFYVEEFLRVPLVQAALRAATPRPSAQVALAFLLSNAVPAIVLTPLAGRCRSLLERLWPDPPPEHESQPKFIRPQALDDPETAMDLLAREIARLLAHVRGLLPDHADAASAERTRSEVERVERNFAALTERIEEFAGQLATHPLDERQAARLARLREELAVVGYAEEAVRDLVAAVEALGDRRHAEAIGVRLLPSVGELLEVAARAAASLDAAGIEALRERSRPHGPFVEQVQPTLVGALGGDTPASRQAVLQVVTKFELIAWVLHRLAKLLPEIARHEIADRPGSAPAATASITAGG